MDITAVWDISYCRGAMDTLKEEPNVLFKLAHILGLKNSEVNLFSAAQSRLCYLGYTDLCQAVV